LIRAWIGLGANLGRRAATLDLALERIAAIDATRLADVSDYYATPPWGDPDQPEFLNAVAAVDTSLAASELLMRLQAIETALGRLRDGRRWGPRAIDLDLLLYASERLATPALTVPHPRLAERAFVLVPLVELAPGLEVPGRGRADELLAALDHNERAGVRRDRAPGFRSQPDRTESRP